MSRREYPSLFQRRVCGGVIRYDIQRAIGLLRFIRSSGAKKNGVCGLGLNSAGRQFPQRWKSKRLVNKCLLGQLGQWDTGSTLIRGSLLGFSLCTKRSLHETIVTCDDICLLGVGPPSQVLLGGQGEGHMFFSEPFTPQ